MTWDPNLAERLLLAERDALLPILRDTGPTAFALPTVCTGWSVRDVLAHCAAALTRIAEDRVHDFCPKCNQDDIDNRRERPTAEVLDELERGYAAAGAACTASGGEYDAIALGEWVHGGDVRAALGKPMAYTSAGINDAITLLTTSKRVLVTPATRVAVPGGQWLLGTPVDGRPTAELTTDLATFVRLYTGRQPDPVRYRLRGARPDELVIYR